MAGRRRKNILLKIALFGAVLLLGSIAIYLGLRIRRVPKGPPPAITEKTPDLYQAREITIKRDEFLRGRYVEVDGNVLYLEISRYGDPTQIEEIQLSEDTRYDCIGRYLTNSKGERIDRLDMFLDTSRLETNEENLPPPVGKSLDWFVNNVQKGEAVEVYFVLSSEEIRKPHTIHYVGETCPSA